MAVSSDRADDGLGLSVVWSRHDPSQIGELLWIPLEGGKGWVFGRGSGNGSVLRITLQRWHPSSGGAARLVECPRISRDQLRLSAGGNGSLVVENLGSCPLVHRGQEIRRVELAVGETISLRNELLLLCVRRPQRLRGSLAALSLPPHNFGRADALGLVGESAVMWQLRERLVAASAQPFHVLVVGASGSGKELIARAIHELSSRRGHALVSRSAATIPAGLVDAELFGNARGYPQGGMAERPGLIGAAHESSLFLDEIGELPHALQAHLLRVLDDGEYQRLGDSKLRKANIRLIAATNRSPSELKHDLVARFALQIEAPDLNARREDIPLLIAHLLRRQALHDRSVSERFFSSEDPDAMPRISPRFVERLVQHQYTTNIRELAGLLATATLESSGAYVDSSALELRLENPRAPRATAETVRAAGAIVAPWLSREESARLELLRKHRFSPTSCGRDSDYAGNRQTADLHFRHLACKALQASSWDANAAARLLAGIDPTLVEKCRARIHKFVTNLEARLASEPAEDLNRALYEDWKGLVDAVLPLIERLRTARGERVPAKPLTRSQ